MIGPFVNEYIVTLRRADAMIEDLVVACAGLELGSHLRFVVAAVEKALAVIGPRRLAPFDPFEIVAKILACRYVAHFPVVPIATGLRETISEILAVVADRRASKGDSAIFGQRIRIEQHMRRTVELIESVQDGLILQTVILGVEVAAADLGRHGEAFV